LTSMRALKVGRISLVLGFAEKFDISNLLNENQQSQHLYIVQ
jgi:hypothetical protein